MKKLFMFFVAIVLAFSLNAQNIMLRSGDAGITKSRDQFTGFQATFSFNQIESVTITGSEAGTFSTIHIADAMPQGEYGAPQLPVFKKMIAIPEDAVPKVIVKNFTSSEHNLADYGIHTIFPLQPDVRKDWDINEVPFIFDTRAYGNNDYNNAPMAEVEILGTMRGVIIGMVTVRPVQYNPVAHSIMVHNDIEVEVVFENANHKKTTETLKNTFSPYFKNVYETFFNRGVTKDLFDDFPDLYSTPVHMLVIAHRMFEATLQPWIEWKTQKGFYMDVNYTDEIGTTAAQIKTFCHNKYTQGITNGTAPTFIIIVGDVQQVPASQTGTATSKATDLYYARISTGTGNLDFFPDMYYSRMSAQTVQHLENIIEKTLYYEKYQFADPTYLDNVLLIAGADATWAPRVGRPQIEYAATHYYNTANGYVGIHKYTTSNYTGCYNNFANVGFANFTAHCGETLWSDPDFTVANVHALTNINKYFVAMGNCCLAADFGYGECIGEAFVRSQKKGAVGYIGSSPNSYWNDDFHFTVGAYNGSYAPAATPNASNTKDGIYDFMFKDADFNTLCSHVFGGNLTVTYAMTTPGYTTNMSPRYYWEAYNVLGDGSIMPYNGQASVNNVSHIPNIFIGLPTYEVMADPGSYVAISKDGVLLGVAVADASGMALVTLDPPISSGGDVDIVVTRNQRQPYIHQVPATAQEGPYVVYSSYEVIGADVLTYISTNAEIEVTVKNVGIETSAPLFVTISTDDPQLNITLPTAQCPAIAPGETASVRLKVTVANDIPNNKTFPVDVRVTEESKAQFWDSRMALKAYAPDFKLEKVLVNGVENGSMPKGSLVTLTAIVKNDGGADAYYAEGELEVNNPFVTLPCANEIITPRQHIPAGESVEYSFTAINSPNIPNKYEVDFGLSLIALYNRSFTTPFKAITVAGSGTYCSNGNQNASSGDNFTSVQILKGTTVLLSNTNSSTNGYVDLTNMVIPLEPGEQYTIKVKTGYGSNTVRGWFDWNGNNTFDANEQIISLTCATAGVEYQQNFTIPPTENIVPGANRFRLVTKFSGTPTACNNSSYGQTHDYTFTLPEMYARVQNVTAVLQEEKITVTWEAPSDVAPLGYNIYRNNNKLNSTLLNVLTFTEENITEEGIYAYFVTAVYAGDKESFAEMSNVICNILPPQFCEEPDNLTVTAGETAVIVTWNEPVNIDGKILEYEVYRNEEKLATLPFYVFEYTDEIELPEGTHTYKVAAVYTHCEAETEIIVEIIGIKEVKTDVFKLFPNPATNTVTIKGAGIAQVEIYDIQGRKLLEQNAEGRTQKELNVSSFQAGVYLVKIYSENNQTFVKRLVITK